MIHQMWNALSMRYQEASQLLVELEHLEAQLLYSQTENLQHFALGDESRTAQKPDTIDRMKSIQNQQQMVTTNLKYALPIPKAEGHRSRTRSTQHNLDQIV